MARRIEIASVKLIGCERFLTIWWESQVMEKINNPHYLYRMTVLVAISLLAPVVGAEPTCQTMLPVVINAAKDRCVCFSL